MGLSADKDVKFDWYGSLSLARQLWAYADDLEAASTVRMNDANAALKSWLGQYADKFIASANDEQTSLTNVIANLRNDATAWAQAWKLAMDQQNRVLYARKVKEVEDNRSGWDSFWGGLTGHDDLPPEPQPVPTPTSPSFAATAGFYSGN
ncbi:MAG: hypothetical protein ACHQDC_09175 [Acidimicrobiales bacterium]|jgi:hypothetical protein